MKQTGGRTDLAVELREDIEDDVEMAKGVTISSKHHKTHKMTVSVVRITTEEAAKAMQKDIGTYITIEAEKLHEAEETERKYVAETIAEQLSELLKKHKAENVLVIGLGNREATPDALGPIAVSELCVTRHLILKLGEEFKRKYHLTSFFALETGVLAQTGMESGEIVKSVVSEMRPDVVIAIDSLASRSVSRLFTTIQLSDTGIYPGAGIGNNRQALNFQTLKVPVLAIGVPTVVDAETIFQERLSQSFQKKGFSEEEVSKLLTEVSEKTDKALFVTPKEIDEFVRRSGETVAEAINMLFCRELL